MRFAPRALNRQGTHHDAHAPFTVDPPVVRPNPGAHPLSFGAKPRCPTPTRGPCTLGRPAARRREPRKPSVTWLARTALHEAQPEGLGVGPQWPVAAAGFGLRSLFVGGE